MPDKDTKDATQIVAGGEVVSLADFTKLKADLEKANAISNSQAATLAAMKEKEKLSVIEKHQARGAIVPATLSFIMKAAATMEADELEKHLASLPVITKITALATGSADPSPAAEAKTGKLTGEALEVAKAFGNVANAEKYGQVVEVSLRTKTVRLADGRVVPMADFNAGRS